MVRKKKIPARKHHGVRDPIKQKFISEQKLKGVINNPPEKGSAQKVSYKFRQFMKLVNDSKSGKKIKKIHSGIEDKPKNEKKGRFLGNKIGSIKQLSNEDDVDYLRRVNRITSTSLKEAEYEIKYGVFVVKDPTTGLISIKKRSPNELDELLKKKNARKLHDNKKIAKDLVKQAIKEVNEEKKNEKHIEEYKKDVVKFGEIVHAPPVISILPRKATTCDSVRRPGMKDNLLLKTLFKAQTAESYTVAKHKTTKTKSSFTKEHLKGKRRDLPITTRNMLEIEQSKLIELYRQLKKDKYQEF